MRAHHPAARLLAVATLLLVSLTACGGNPAPTDRPSGTASGIAAPSASAVPSATPAPDPEAAAAYSTAICPIFDAILTIDPRLVDLRTAGGEGGDMTAFEGDLRALSDELRIVLNDLDEVPEWEPGNRFRFELTTSLHAIRAEILAVSRDTSDPGAAAALAALPFVASPAMDRAFANAVEGGLECAGGS